MRGFFAATLMIGLAAAILTLSAAAQPPAAPVPAAPAAGANPGPLVRLAVRAKLRTELEKAGHPRARVNDLMRHVTDDVIDHATREAGVVVTGRVTDWLLAHKDEILAIVKILLALFAV